MEESTATLAPNRPHTSGRPARRPLAAKSNVFATTIRRSILRLAPGRIHELTVEANRDAVILRGRCGSYYCKQVAQTAAMELAGKVRVDNRIQVA